MPTIAGPNTYGEENLVFGYDLGDVSNSYKGEPTENLITDTATFDSSFWNQKSGTITANDAIGPRGIQNAAKIVATNTDPYIYSSAIVTASTGNSTWSIWVKGIGNTVGKSAQVRINFSGTATGTADTNASVNLTERWQLLQTTANVTSGGTIKFGLEAPNGAVSGDIMYFADPMFEQKSHATQFVNGTRSATQGLIDLKGNSTIDLTNVSFDSNAQMTFDGTNDYADLGSYLTGIDTSILSIELVFKSNTSTGGFIPLLGWMENESPHGYICTGDFTGYWGNESISFFNSGPTALSFAYTNGHAFLNDTNYHHVVFILQTNGYRIYVDGNEVTVNPSFRNGSSSTTMPSNLFGYGSTPSVVVGAGSDAASYANARVPVVKIYNRVLTALEVRSNFNAIKGRFNI